MRAAIDRNVASRGDYKPSPCRLASHGIGSAAGNDRPAPRAGVVIACGLYILHREAVRRAEAKGEAAPARPRGIEVCPEAANAGS